MSAEAAAIKLGGAVAARAVRLWLAPKEREQQARAPMGELIRVRVPGLRAGRGVERQFEQIADAVAGRVQPLLEHEFRDLTENGREAVLQAVTDTFARVDLSDEAVLGSDADPAELTRRVRSSVPMPSGFSEVETRFYEVVLGECCDCYVRVLRRLPVFTERAVSELLARTTSLGDELEKVLERLPARSLYAPQGTGEDEAFRRQYLELISRSLDEIELFGLGPSEQAPRTKLSVAYVSLRTSEDDGGRGRSAPKRPLLRRGAQLWDTGEGERTSSMRVEAALKGSPRVLLRGEAGSGKTTLLQWLAVTAARGAFTGALAEWNGLIPVLVKLRQYAGEPPPTPEAMLDRVAGPLSGLMPTGWLHRAFADGRVLLLVDGVDELLAGERRGVRDWLRGLLHLYADTRVVVTSRPAAARVDWLRAERFTALQLERMTPADLVSFVRQWHQAVYGQDAGMPCSPEELPGYERSLLTSLQDRPHLQSLATNPLLAALLCALHLARRGQLPRNRMELYRMTLEVLVQQRDTDRGVHSELAAPLTLTDKLCLLRDLAWRLSDNSRTEISVDRAADHVSTKLVAMRHLDGLEGPAVLDHLVHRSGVLRSPVEGRLDFLHRTFQEYLAAQEAAVEDRIGNLVGRAHLDLWRETVVMAAGHANRTQQEELLGGILERAEREPRHARTLRLVAASCQETMASVPSGLAAVLDEAVVRLVPPRRKTEADALAVVGAPVMRWLPPTLEGVSAKTAEATIRTVRQIGGERALARMERYASDSRVRVQQLLMDSWEYFDADAYADSVLRKLSLEQQVLFITHAGQWSALSRLKEACWLSFGYPFSRSLAFLDERSPVRGLWIEDVRGDVDLTPLRAQTDLGVLSLRGKGRLENLDAIEDLTDLTILKLRYWPVLPPLDHLAVLDSLHVLELGTLPPGYDLSRLTRLTNLTDLTLSGTGQPCGIDDPAQLAHLARLELDGYDLDGWALRDALPECVTLLNDCVLPAAFEPPAWCALWDCRTPDGRPHPLNAH
ncbi:NACHT domain-containing protein [Streptomyces sp. Je 1-369]|uniref:NACHT domain-containing protein n=1 Tax=Streptomyces sp. Je 1-369 TaxID=2966192 RepID=UPI002286AC10|nr:NACHT domain-containing protein [Streptomyces sp. Je 1-369]WAL98072.1 NACHT domain-containing protein [Streptomyces sp. Je 1-369]